MVLRNTIAKFYSFDKIIALFLLFALILFSVGRGHYFIMPPNYAKGFDGVWHYAYQAQLQREKSEPLSNEYQKSRHKFRTIQDQFNSYPSIFFSEKLGISLLKSNLILSSAIYLLSIFSLLVLGFKTLSNQWLAFLFTFLCLQSPYGNFLAWSATVTKMWSYALYPLVLLAVLSVDKSRTSYIRFCCIFLLLACMYVPGASYIAIPLFFVMFLKATINTSSRQEKRKTNFSGLLILAFGALSFLVIALLSKPPAISVFPSAEIYQYFNNGSNWWVPFWRLSPSVQVVLTQMSAMMVVALFIVFINRRRLERDWSIVLDSFIIFSILLISAQLGSWIASTYPEFRPYFFERAYSYSYIPGLLIGLFLLKQITEVTKKWYGYSGSILKITLLTIVTVIIFHKVSVSGPGLSGTVGESFRVWANFYNGRPLDKDSRIRWPAPPYERINALVEFIDSLPAGARFLLPAPRYQWKLDMYLEAGTGRSFVPMGMDSHLSMAKQDLTEPYYLLSKELEPLIDLRNLEDVEKLLRIAKKQNTQYLVVHTGTIEGECRVNSIYRNESWSVITSFELESFILRVLENNELENSCEVK